MDSPNLIRIGIIGGGQLGKMMILEGKKLGIQFVILDPDRNCPASSIADKQIIGDYYDVDQILTLAKECHIITYEFEHIDVNILMDLEKKGYIVEPSPNTLKTIQNKYRQKTFLKNHKIPIPPFEKVSNIEDIKNYIDKEGLPVILKSCYGGYDGKGNQLIRKMEDIQAAYDRLDGSKKELMVEKYVHFTKEVSLVVARSTNGEIKAYPLAENIHEDNILRTTIVPARVDKAVADEAASLALKVMQNLDGAGVFCIEMFIDEEGQVLVNEIAPRVHNSGHYTIEGCNISQFQQHLRAILGYPLARPYLIKPSLMINILGEENMEGEAVIEGFHEVLKDSDAYLHFYGKEYTKPLRKMGHVTLLGDNINEMLKRAENIRNTLKVTSKE